MKKNYGGLVWGAAFIAAGILFALNIANVINFDIWANIWPLLFVFVGLSVAADNRKSIAGYLFIIFGILWFLNKQFGFNIDIKYIAAAVLVLIGIVIIYNVYFKKDIPVTNPKTSQFVFFAGRTDRIAANEYLGTNTFCLFGGHDIDLREYVFHNDVRINVTAIFGGVGIILPENVNIVIYSLPVFGGVENKCQNTGNNPYTVYINATAVFGGVELKNKK